MEPDLTPRFRKLARDECELLIARNHVGRIAYAEDRQIVIFPVYYVYAEGWIYGRMQRRRKKALVGWYDWWPVSFQVDEVDDLFHWRTVLVHGGFYTLAAEGAEEEQEIRRHAIELLRELIPQTLGDGDPMPSHTGVFRIAVQEISGSEAMPRD